jgi:hypothetical protein
LTDHQKRAAICRRDRDGEPVYEIAGSYKCLVQRDFTAHAVTPVVSYGKT